MEQRKGEYQETYIGKFYAIDPRVEEVNLEDIAHGLSLICRYTGQCTHFYSVAQHCLNVYRDLEEQGYDLDIQLWGLLHDATEVYISDLPTPFKVEMPEYNAFEKNIEKVIYEKFGLDYPDEETYKIIKNSDREVLCNEVELIMRNEGDWASKYPHKKIDIDVSFRDMKEVEIEYFNMVKELIKKRNKE